ncbi:hypothetical protein NKI56_34940 [Mesorhizobium sp. M0622]|uniref:hypothetical protein n=1 Tax=Mesorhizobium sp. M0622 TaxID=2956975 RepID=UPI003338424F
MTSLKELTKTKMSGLQEIRHLGRGVIGRFSNSQIRSPPPRPQAFPHHRLRPETEPNSLLLKEEAKDTRCIHQQMKVVKTQKNALLRELISN